MLHRRSRFSRGSALDGSEAQVLAAKIDRVWIVHGLDTPLNDRKLERYLAVAWESGASPEIVLTKSDLADDVQAALEQAGRVGFGAPVRAVGTHDRDRKGRHTSTVRQLFKLPGGGPLLDTTGLRQLRVWDLDTGLAAAFPEVDRLAQECRFRDCRHETEPGCAVLAAVEAGELDAERLASFRKLEAEAAYHLRKTDPRAKNEAIAEYKSIMKSLKLHPKFLSRK